MKNEVKQNMKYDEKQNMKNDVKQNVKNDVKQNVKNDVKQDLKYCIDCGSKLVLKNDGIDKNVPYCEHCQKYQYETFNSAISAVVCYQDKILLIKQYQKPDYILVAGYISKGENAKETLKRELKEETGLTLKKFIYNDNQYYQKTNTLMHNYIAYGQGDIHINNEIDSYELFSFKDAIKAIKPNSLAKHFLIKAYLKLNLEKYLIIQKEHKLVIEDEADNEIAYAILTPKEDKIEITSIFVDPEYRGGTIASSLVQESYHYIKENNKKALLKCSYAIAKFKEHPDYWDILDENQIAKLKD